MTDKNAIQAMPFETALGELEKIVRQLETGDIALDDSIKAYERGVALKNQCALKLKDAQVKIEQIGLDTNGHVKTKPFDDTKD